MLKITIDINAEAWEAMGIKEDLTVYLERWGDAKVVSVEQKAPSLKDQMMIGRSDSRWR